MMLQMENLTDGLDLKLDDITDEIVPLSTSQALREYLWKHTLSGSQMKSLMNYPRDLHKLKTTNITREFSEKSKAKMRAGTDLEEYVYKRFIGSLHGDYKLGNYNGYGDLVKDTTYVKRHNGILYSANIDAYGIEVKWTEVGDIDVLIEMHYAQLQYYMWFFDVPYWTLTAMVNGWELIYKNVSRDDNYISRMLTYSIVFNECLSEDNESVIFMWEDEERPTEKVSIDLDTLGDGVKETLYKYATVNEKMKDLEVFKKEANKDIKDILERYRERDMSIDVATDYGKFSYATVTKKGKINYEEIVKDLLPNLTREQIMAYTDEATSYTTLRFTKKRGVELSDLNDDEMLLEL